MQYVFASAIALIAILLVISSFPITGNYRVMIVQSGSMAPQITTGSIVVVKPANTYKIGDVITFGKTTKGKMPTTHRIVEIRVVGGRPLYTTKGDANNAPDVTETAHGDILGRVLFNVPYFGYALAAAKKPIGFAMLIVIPASIVVFDEGKKIWRELASRRKQAEIHEAN